MPDDVPAVGPSELHADCARCFALCCVALPFAASADWRFPAATLGIRTNLTHAEKPWPDVAGETIFELSQGGAAGPAIVVAIDRKRA